MNKYIFDCDLSGLEKVCITWGEPEYRALQIWEGLYQQYWETPQQFSPLPLDMRDRLQDEFTFSHLEPVDQCQANDRLTHKTAFRLPDGPTIEVVLMRYTDRNTLCISSQAGCAMGCEFCATGQMGFQRHLSSGEIVEQVVYYARTLEAQKESLTNVVFMGMGEPFHNYDAVMEAIQRLRHPQGMNLGARRFTISTVGIVPKIRQFAHENTQVNLAVSLHAVDDELRSSMMPINKTYPVSELLDACKEYVSITNRRISFEWALIQGVNDTPEQARNLAALIRGMLAHVNIIPLNPTEGYGFAATTEERAGVFQKILIEQGVSCTIRERRGIDIQAGCGQLARKYSSEE
ncbi:MAG: 23S rRNA (adenine(2503)-C(2))-methyltransferase RlmN [Anaerolineales bacterium]